ncbi:PREDICTED: uncharacterized protein LOC100636161 isoform X3 [Amphimedon queenslandica]|uniref:Mitogen-activated protein kinase kinase kinase n=1 Tax=Amphimedon queenslandica TaxID=400682 RepID=A0AAN0JAL6_AMPQE|nr:PREDICTED: uncharacterized protein LOC100636161 isoform X3 [Amphimedon queenslandica]|eukprot:XP_019854019.1 PREDICTED: uncharacterized protein LOC100636161 isoform X3 [Amphimedon queenslandica]
MSKAEKDFKKVIAGTEYPVIEEIALKFKPKDTLIGIGSSDRVRFATHEGRDVAVKYSILAREHKELEQEKHDNIAVLLGTGPNERFIIREFAPYSLETVLHGSYPHCYTYEYNHVMHWARQTAVGLEYLHSKGFLCPGIKPSNLLLFGNGSHLKLCDFCSGENSWHYYDASDAIHNDPVRYTAPEVLRGTSYSTEKRDIFNFAITLWEMLARQEPVVTEDDTETIFEGLNQMANGRRPPLLVGHPSFVNELLQKCWNQDPGVRLTSTELVEKFKKICEHFKFGEPISLEYESAVGKWMEEGSVDLTVTRVNMLGAPGAGKTCSQLLLLNEDPPTNDTSTPIACPAVRATRVAVSDKMIWNRVTRANLLDELATNLTTITAHSEQEKTKQPPAPAVLSLPDNTESSAEVSSDLSPTPHDPTPAVSSGTEDIKEDKKYHTEAVVQEILATQPKGIRKSDHWLYVIDSGGQPAYQELLPLFTRAASLNIITLDLSKPFNERFDLMYRIDGKYFPCHSKSTQLAFFQSAVSTGASFEPLDISCISKKPTHSMHLVLGTHYDKVSDATLKEKEEILMSSMSSLESYLQNCVISQSDDSIIFPVNAIAASEERAKYSEEICKAIWYRGSDASLKIKIPIRWFVFELSLPEQSIVSVKEALSIGKGCSMEKEDTKQALKYFHDVSLMLYYPEVINVIFIDSKPILEILSQLLALTYVNKIDAIASISDKPLSPKITKNLKEGFFNEDIFEHLKSRAEVFSLPEFQLSDLIRLLLHLNIITKLEDEPKGHYFIPYALPSYNEPVSIKETNAKPLLIVWREEESEEILPVPTGLFPLTIVHLLNQKDYVTKISPSTSEYYKFRDAISLRITFTQKHTLHLINRYTHIEVYFTGPTQHCPLVRKLLTTAIDNSSDAMHLKHNYVNAFACPVKRNSCYCIVGFSKDGHFINCTMCSEPATISDDHWNWYNIEGSIVSNKQENFLLIILDKKPQLDDLHRLFQSSDFQFLIIGTALGVQVNDLQHSPMSASDKLLLVFQRWINSNMNITWRKALQVCEDYPDQFGLVKSDVIKFLSSDRAHDKYSDGPVESNNGTQIKQDNDQSSDEISASGITDDNIYGGTYVDTMPATITPAVRRLMKEATELREPFPHYYTQPMEDNLFEWHFTIQGPPGTDYEGGRYHGHIMISPEYPMKPPSVVFLTPNGRFKLNLEICMCGLETWQSYWGISTVLLELIDMMATDDDRSTFGSLDCTPEERRQLATRSLEWVCPSCGVANRTALPEGSEDIVSQMPKEEVNSQQPHDLDLQKEALLVAQFCPPSTDQSNQRNIDIKESHDQSKDEGGTEINKESSTSGIRYRGQEETDQPLSASPPPPSFPANMYIILFFVIVIVILLLLILLLLTVK